MKVLITGGAGFIGVNLAAHMTRRGGFDITVVDNETLGRREHLGDLPARFVHGDIRDRAVMERLLGDCDAVVHLAAHTRVIESIEDPALNFDINVAGLFTLFEAARAQGVKKLVSASSGGAILGEVPPPIHEEMPPRPMSPYGASKLVLEAYGSAYAQSYGFSCSAMRFSNVYGPNSFHKGSVVAHFFKRILAGQPLVVYGDGEQIRDFIFVSDLCESLCLALERDVWGAYQLGSGQPTSVNQLIALMRETVGPDHPVTVRYEPARAGEILRTWSDISKARRDLDFNLAMGLTEGLRRTWRWFLDRSAKGATPGNGV